MPETLEKQLEKLDKSFLIEIITGVANENASSKKLVNTLLAIHNPKLMAKEINKEISAIKRGSKFIDYYHVAEFTNSLYSISDKIDKYLALQAPDLAINLCKKLIDMDGKLFERVDDSGGDVGCFYSDLFIILDKSLAHSSNKPTEIVDYIIELRDTDEYGNRGHITDALNCCLNDDVISCFKEKLSVRPMSDFKSKDWDERYKNISNINILKKIADKKKNVDEYIKLCQLAELSDSDICEIASRLNNAFRSSEAIDWLNRTDEHTNCYLEKSKLLQEAYHLEGEQELERSVIWERFKTTLSPADYAAYLKLVPEDEKGQIKNKAYDFAIKNSPSLQGSLGFFQYLGDYDAIEDLFLASMTDNNIFDYSFYRKLSTALYQNNKPLSATLMRRILIDEVLDAARSKYYRYAVNDLHQSIKFANEVSDWKNQDNHEQYMEQIKQKHFRKYSFWEQLNNDKD